MKRFILFGMLLFGCQMASAQQDLYTWQLRGYTGLARYVNDANSSTDYFKTDDNLLYRVELSRHIGNSVALSLGYTVGDVWGSDPQGNAFTTGVHLSALRAYFYTDNGWLLPSMALVSPYVFGGYGFSILKTSHQDIEEESRYVPAIPFGVGLKFRIAERWQAALQAEWVYHTERHLPEAALEQHNRYDAYLHTGITVGYSFGFRKSTFKAPQFYVGDSDLLRPVAERSQPRQNMLEAILKLEPKEAQVNSLPDATVLPEPVVTKVPVDTALVNSSPVEVDTSTQAQPLPREVVSAEPNQAADTATTTLQTISSARSMIRLDSIMTQGELRPLPTAQRNVVVLVDTLVQVQGPGTPEETQKATRQERPAARTQERELTSEKAETKQQQVRAAPERERTRTGQRPAPARREPARAQQAAPARKTEAGRVAAQTVAVPSQTILVPVPAMQADTAQLRKEQFRQALIEAEIRRLQSKVDSLQALKVSDTIRIARDSSLTQNLQQQVLRTDSLVQRLNQYEQEVARLKQAKARPATPPTAPAPTYTGATVFFPFNAHRVPTGSLQDLKQVLSTLQENPHLQVKLTGYASRSGSAAYNMALSRKRVEALEKLLTDQGIAKERVQTAYRGDEASSQKDSPLDRKVEIEIFE
ncbi:outer membrane protein with beta-barrel domain [Pontibacter ummariensis]|uniref:Outer membrane protein beta-barrel domain-containing protein n=1 Tax=Pontibacter ummariensis TaxID=1610492 RepID=A0A239I2Q2_9BACT|nr:OmpA family protein [Pontibacter ummariensis]PRY10135.1 outer membrane protein with beta-barrel domain [Pontibacter ummariensis]SNS86644.1 Outer membrane protein beta-barrel domain-containing protein [Pontibacter ummariensis]